ncbi:MAG: hypothetical protein NC338_01855 [Firmicutes bacterium]|nr:hypothetical protein [Bacillota bacterium]MCM1401219.1 hypothetical protein [Bacteroides sp.]MCM1477084.1 hypothetical protein [Bacteroides sp.]
MLTMNDSFSPARIAALTNKYLKENWRGLLLKTGTMYGMMILMALLFVWGFNESYNTTFYPAIYEAESSGVEKDPAWLSMFNAMIFGSYLFISISASLTFSDMSSKQGRLGVITFPSRNIEKFITRCIVYIIGGTLLYIGSCLVAETVRVAFLKAIVQEPSMVHFLNFNIMFTDMLGNNGTTAVIYFLLLSQALFLLGGTVWPKFAFVKTFIFLSVLVIAYAFIFYLTTESLGKFSQLYVAYSDSVVSLILKAVVWTVVIFCYVTSFFRFKEMEIINRW